LNLALCLHFPVISDRMFNSECGLVLIIVSFLDRQSAQLHIDMLEDGAR